MAPVDFASLSVLLTLFLILLSGFGNKPRKHKSKRCVMCICILGCFNRNLECHLNLEVWNSFLILSCLSVFLLQVDAHQEQSLKELRDVLMTMEPLINKSNALLYTPPENAVNVYKNCTHAVMHCFLLELNVVLHEENYSSQTLHDVYSMLQRNSNTCDHCPVTCEAFSVESLKTFLERMQTFIEKLRSSDLASQNVC